MRRRALPIAFLVSMLLTLLLVSLWTFKYLSQSIGLPREAYASDWTATFIIDHLRTSGDWPKKWEELRDEYDRLAVPEHYAWTFDELQTIVNVDWNADLSQIRSATKPLELVRLASGKHVHFNGDPNKLIWDFVQTGIDPNRVQSRIGEHSPRTPN